MDTINRLLKKQPPKRGRRAIREEVSDNDEGEPEPEKPNPLYVRYIQTTSGTRLAIPNEWLQAPVGSLFAENVAQPSNRPYGGRMVEEVS
jgi:Ino eighty subunit 2